MGFLKSIVADARSSGFVEPTSAQSNSLPDAGINSLSSENTNTIGADRAPVQERLSPGVRSPTSPDMGSNEPEGNSTLTDRPDLMARNSKSDLLVSTFTGDDPALPEASHHGEKDISVTKVKSAIDVATDSEHRIIDVTDEISVSPDIGPEEDSNMEISGYSEHRRKDSVNDLSTEAGSDGDLVILEGEEDSLGDASIPGHFDETFSKSEIISNPLTTEDRDDPVNTIEDLPLATGSQKSSGVEIERRDIGEKKIAGANGKDTKDSRIIITRAETSHSPATNKSSANKSTADKSSANSQRETQKTDNHGDNHDQLEKVFHAGRDPQPGPATIEQKSSDTATAKPHPQGKREVIEPREKRKEVKPVSAVVSPALPVKVQPRVARSEPISKSSTRYVEKNPRGRFIDTPKAPEVRIGQVDVFIEAPKETEGLGKSKPRPTPPYSSRNYLRRL